MINIIGHKNPDTDATCSAIAYSILQRQKGIKTKAFTLGQINKETKFVLDYFGIQAPEKISELPINSQVILVDHNEKKQTIDNISQLELVEIIDHHKVDIQTDKPISILIKPLGSTCSIIAEKFFQEGIALSRNIAGILLSAIISDTLYFRSPTTTEDDRELVKKLNNIVRIKDLEEYSLKMFKAKSDLGDISIEELIKLDYKVFDFKGKQYGIGVMETTNINYGLDKKNKILEKLREIKETDNLKSVYFIIVDILKGESYTLYSDAEAKELFIKLFSAQNQKGVLFVDNLVSRKKQIVPVFEAM